MSEYEKRNLARLEEINVTLGWSNVWLFCIWLMILFQGCTYGR